MPSICHVGSNETPSRACVWVLNAGRMRVGAARLLVDMVAHDRDTYQLTMGHEHLGFEESAILGLGERGGFDRVSWRRLRPMPGGKGPGLFAASLFKSS